MIGPQHNCIELVDITVHLLTDITMQLLVYITSPLLTNITMQLLANITIQFPTDINMQLQTDIIRYLVTDIMIYLVTNSIMQFIITIQLLVDINMQEQVKTGPRRPFRQIPMANNSCQNNHPVIIVNQRFDAAISASCEFWNLNKKSVTHQSCSN